MIRRDSDAALEPRSDRSLPEHRPATVQHRDVGDAAGRQLDPDHGERHASRGSRHLPDARHRAF